MVAKEQTRREIGGSTFISIGKRQIHLGVFATLDEARTARKAAEQRYFAGRQEKADKIKKKLKKGLSHVIVHRLFLAIAHQLIIFNTRKSFGLFG